MYMENCMFSELAQRKQHISQHILQHILQHMCIHTQNTFKNHKDLEIAAEDLKATVAYKI